VSTPQVVLPVTLVATLVAQAALPSRRLLIVLGGAGLSCLLATLSGVASMSVILAEVPWEVLVLLVGLALVSELFRTSHLFSVLAVRSARWSGGTPRWILVLFVAGMYVVSGLVNNLTALLLVLPILLILLRLIGASQRQVTWTLGCLLVACNLGGAATPIGDFPAVLLLGRGSMSFVAYLERAAPATFVGLLLVLGIGLFALRAPRAALARPVPPRIGLAVMAALYRNVRLEWGTLAPTAVAFAGMLAAWITVPPGSGVGPELICWLGAGAALVASPARGEQLLRGLDVEPVLYFLALFLMVGAVRDSGIFTALAHRLVELPLSPGQQLVVFLLIAGPITGVFSAGPGMAALIEVAETLATHLPPNAVYVGLALSVCAGSSLFLTAATSGPMAQMMVERADLRDLEGRRLRFGFVEFLPVGLVGFVAIESVAIGYALLSQ
jgi:Na+/H+ antiporter NhaD/arsenite permease-like protein